MRKAGRRGEGSAAAPKVDIAAARAFAVERLVGAEVAEKFGNASFTSDGKVFAFTRPEGLVLKLPPDVLLQVVAERDAVPLVMGKRVMREWVVLPLEHVEAYRDEVELLQAAMKFVARELQRARRKR
jgi:hypothetical protein